MNGNPMQRVTNEPISLRDAPRCGARTRHGKPCQSPILKGKRRCRMHGGAHGSGAPCSVLYPMGCTDRSVLCYVFPRSLIKLMRALFADLKLGIR